MFLHANQILRMRGLLCLSVIICLLFGSEIAAKRGTINFRHIGTEQGLPQSTINTIFQDSHGFIWIGTYDGLSRYDGYRFVSFKNNPNDPDSLSNNIVVSIIEDQQGFLWVGTAQNGVNRFNPNTGKFTRFLADSNDFDSLSHPQVRVIHQDTQGRIWIGTDHGLNLFLPEKQAFAHFYHNPLDDQSLPQGSIVAISDDGNGNLWVASNQQLTHFDVEQQIFTRYQSSNAPQQINTLYLDTDNSLWLGTRLDGLYHLRPDQTEFVRYQRDNKNPASISNNDVRAILRVRSGDLWVGTEEGGLNIRRKGSDKFQRFERNSADSHSLTINDIWSLYQDKSGLIWVGTAGGGINITQSFESRLSRLTHSPRSGESLSHEFVWDIEEDSHGKLWFATLNGLDQYDPGNDTFKHYNEFFDQQNNPIGNRVLSITFDERGRIWFGNQQGQVAVLKPGDKKAQLIQRDNFTRGFLSYNRIRMLEKDRFGFIWVGSDDGLLKIDAETLQITETYNFTDLNQLGASSVRTMLQDETGIIWFGTWGQGLQRFDPEFGSVSNFKNSPGDNNSISDNTVHSLYKDGLGNLWIGTFNGLNMLSAKHIQEKSYRFKSYLEKDGLPNSTIYAIAGDTNGRLWLSTNKGLSEFDPDAEKFNNYTVEDGLTSNEFNGNAAIRALSGDIYFGSVNGVSIVSPVERPQANFTPQVKITEIAVAGKAFLPRGVPFKSQPVVLNYDSNDLVFQFSALDYRHSKRNLFQYRLLPYSKDWTAASGDNQAVFTNLDPNRYTFELRASNSFGDWIEQPVTLTFLIKPPLWQTWWAYFLYFAGFIALLAYYLNKQERTLQEQRAINEHLRRVDQLKDEFLANTSHELRTPLNGIIGIAESLKEGIAGLQNQKTLSHLQLIIDGGKRLAQLVNDILDFKKLSHHTLILQRKAVDLSAVIDVVVSLLNPLAQEKNLQIFNLVESDLPLVYADENRIQQVLHNLIGNAIKYTPKGRIEIRATSKNNFVEFCVSDTGIGIDASQLELIFKPFEQAMLDETISNRGTGLGLSVTNQLIEEHGGSLWVKSEINQGSQFFFELPVWLENVHENADVESITRSQPSLPVSAQKESHRKTLTSTINKLERGRVLIADDDPINLQVLEDLLTMNGFEVQSADNGTTAVELGENESFDLAIIDIMMPGLSGYEVCKALRKKYSPIELPILLLSARNQPGDISAGFEAGANDYVTKPIEREVLLSRINTMSLLRGLVDAKQQQEHNTTLQQACEKLGKYFPKQMVRQIVTGDKSNPLIAQRKRITVLFADLAGFTSISDRFEPESITDILNSFLGKMGQLIEAENGVLNEILGDGLVVLFGALDNMDKSTQAISAARLALQMREAMSELAEQWLEAGIDHNVSLRVGIHQDFATVGNFGSDEIVAFRAVGSGVNLAARLENYSPNGKITVSYPIYAQCRNEFEFTELEEVQFKGFNHPHRVCQLTGKK